MISSLLHLVGLRPRVYYTLTNFRGGGKAPLPPPQYANESCNAVAACPEIRKGVGGQKSECFFFFLDFSIFQDVGPSSENSRENDISG